MFSDVSEEYHSSIFMVELNFNCEYTDCPRRKGHKILGDDNIGHSKQESVYVHVSYSERFPR
jgi:hypothetical protein